MLGTKLTQLKGYEPNWNMVQRIGIKYVVCFFFFFLSLPFIFVFYSFLYFFLSFSLDSILLFHPKQTHLDSFLLFYLKQTHSIVPVPHLPTAPPPQTHSQPPRCSDWPSSTNPQPHTHHISTNPHFDHHEFDLTTTKLTGAQPQKPTGAQPWNNQTQSIRSHNQTQLTEKWETRDRREFKKKTKKKKSLLSLSLSLSLFIYFFNLWLPTC